MRATRKPCFIAKSLITILLLNAFLAVGVPSASADLAGPRASDRQVTLIVAALLNQEHLLKRPLDDEISQRAIEAFLKRLDPMKVYFYQSDIDEIMKDRDRLDDFVKAADLDFAFDVFNRFLKRVDERVEFVEQLLSEDHDFTVDEQMVTDPELAEYPTSREDAFDRWRKRIKYDLLVLKTEDGSNFKNKISKLFKFPKFNL